LEALLRDIATTLGTIPHKLLPSSARNALVEGDLGAIQVAGAQYFPGGALELAATLQSISGIKSSGTVRTAIELAIAGERLLDSPTQSQSGAFFTHPALAQRIVDRIRKIRGSTFLTDKFLDPACGAGIFLLARLQSELRSAQPTIRAATLQTIHGVERDPVLVRVARSILTIGIIEQWPDLRWDPNLLTHQIQHFDSLLTPISGPESWNSRFGRPSFDLIVGNPPFGIARGGGFLSEDQTVIRKNLPGYLRGKLNAATAFLALSNELIDKEGLVTLILPNAWLGISSARLMRERLVDTGRLARIERFDQQLFPGLGVETDIVTIEPANRSEGVLIERYQTPTDVEPYDTTQISFQDIKHLPEHVIPVATPNAALTLSLRLLAAGTRLGDPDSGVKPQIALQAYAQGKGAPPQSAAVVAEHPFDRETADSPTTIRFLEGRDIERFRLRWSGGYLAWGEWLAEPQSLDRFQGPRVVVREVLGVQPYRCRAAVLTEPYLYNKSILHVLPVGEPSAGLLWFIAGLLNSKLGSFLLTVLGRKSQRKLFPKLVLQDLRDLPLPRLTKRETAALGEKIQGVVEASANTGPLDDKVDSLIEGAFALSDDDRRILQSTLTTPITPHSKLPEGYPTEAVSA
jgi:hypothetical protein